MTQTDDPVFPWVMAFWIIVYLAFTASLIFQAVRG